jgi:sugar porter (SP) family MFS transporter
VSQSNHMVFDQSKMEVNSVDESKAFEWKRVTFSLIYTCIMVNLSSFWFGYQLGVINSPKTAIIHCSTLPWRYFQPCIPMTEFQWTVAVSIFPIGGLIGGLIFGYIADMLGRKQSIHFTNFLLVIGSALTCLFSNYYLFVVGRFLCGVSAAGITIVAPMYLQEISPTYLRGFIGNTFEFSNCFAILVAQVMGIWMSNQPGWRYLLGIQIVFSIGHSALHFGSVESPRWLYCVGRHEDAKVALDRLRGEDSSIELDSFRSSDENSQGETKFVWRRSLIRPLIAGVALHVIQAFSGVNIIFFYSTALFEASGIKNAEVSTAVLGGAAVFVTFIVGFVIEKFGRRPLLISGEILQFLSFIVLALTRIFNYLSPAILNVISVVALVVFVIGFSFSLGPIPWLMIAELYPSDARATMASIIVTINWGSQFIVTVTFPTMLEYLKNYTFLVYAFLMFIFIIFSILVIPETKGKSIEEITGGI